MEWRALSTLEMNTSELSQVVYLSTWALKWEAIASCFSSFAYECLILVSDLFKKYDSKSRDSVTLKFKKWWNQGWKIAVKRSDNMDCAWIPSELNKTPLNKRKLVFMLGLCPGYNVVFLWWNIKLPAFRKRVRRRFVHWFAACSATFVCLECWRFQKLIWWCPRDIPN